MTFYGNLQNTASRLMSQYKQGSVSYQITGEPTGPSWNPVPGALETHPLDATVRGVSGKYMNDTLIRMTDLEVTCAVFGAEPSLSGQVVIDGRTHEIVRVEQLPGAGTVLAWRLVVRA